MNKNGQWFSIIGIHDYKNHLSIVILEARPYKAPCFLDFSTIQQCFTQMRLDKARGPGACSQGRSEFDFQWKPSYRPEKNVATIYLHLLYKVSSCLDWTMFSWIHVPACLWLGLATRESCTKLAGVNRRRVCSLDVGVGQALWLLSHVCTDLLAHLAGEGRNGEHAFLTPTGALTPGSLHSGSGVRVAPPGRGWLFLQDQALRLETWIW